MAKNIEMQYYNGSSYEVVYPKTIMTNVTGTLGVANGGTGRATLTSGSYLVGNGTGAVTLRTAAQVLSNIGAAPAYTYGTEDLEAGVTALETGKVHFVYE